MTNGMSGTLGERTPGYLADPMHLWRNDNGQFTDVSAEAGISATGQGRGLLIFDYDQDGDQDILVVNNDEGPLLLRNDGGNENDWLRIAVTGTQSNRDGIGTLITVVPDLTRPDESLLREIDGGSNYLGQNELAAHFGLGMLNAKETVDLVTILWPGGREQEFTDVPKNTALLITELVPEPTAEFLMNAVVFFAMVFFRRLRIGNWVRFS